jgi:hypothetical protein
MEVAHHHTYRKVSAMDHNTVLVTVYCLIDDWLQTQPRLRARGRAPRLKDSEVLTMEVVGELLSIETESGLFKYFRRHYAAWFPQMRHITRTTFTRQMANLRWVKERLWQHLLSQLDMDPTLSVVDSFPVPVCRFARAYRCKRLRAWAAWGYDDVLGQRFLGLRAHVRIAFPGVITALALYPANEHDRWAAEDLLVGAQGWVLGDTNYWSPTLRDTLARQGAILLAPRKTSVKRERHPWPPWLTQARRRVETVIGQLVERFHAKRVWARTPHHLCSRWLRKILCHTFAVFLCQQAELASPLQFALLMDD